MGDYFVIFANVILQGLIIYSLIIVIRFFCRVFKYKAKIVSDLVLTILMSALGFSILVYEVVFLAKCIGILTFITVDDLYKSIYILQMPILIELLFGHYIFAYNDGIHKLFWWCPWGVLGRHY